MAKDWKANALDIKVWGQGMGTGMGRKLTAIVLALVAWAGPAQAQNLTNAQHEAAVRFVLNNTRHVMLHEIGHLFVDQLDLPVLGKEEDAVDNMATLLMLEEGDEDSIVALRDTVDGWLYSESTRPSRGYVNSDFYGSHSLDIQRSFAIACLMVGSDFDAHTRYATRISLPIDRQESCAEDYRVAAKGWRDVLDTHRRTSSFGAPISVVYRDSRGEFDHVQDLIEQARVLENSADWITKNYVLPNPVRMSAEACGEVNAFYDPSQREVILCYEWVDFFYDLFVEDILPVREHFAMMRKLKLEKLGRAE